MYEEIVQGKKKIAVVGMGYVGMPIAVEFAKHVDVIGFDLNTKKIELYKAGIEPTNEVGNDIIKTSRVHFTADEKELREADFFIVAVPTPVNGDKTPDLSPVIGASEIVGRNMKNGSFVVYESTVYPGVTESVCVPTLSKESGLEVGRDYKIGYSPERINPGDKIHRLTNIKKIVSACDAEALEEIAKVYEIIIEAGVFRASSIKVAEAAKVVENSQRDINIAFMNELAMVFDKMGISTKEVIEAMNTKWNSLGFYPGLVGGHCIGVDPYYFVYQAEKLGYHSQIISAGRKINDDMGKFIGDAIIKQLVLVNKRVKEAKVAILGITFKENCPDIRNSKVIDIIERLREYGIKPYVTDEWAEKEEVKWEYGINLVPIEEIRNVDCVVVAVAHDVYKRMSEEQLIEMFGDTVPEERVIIDVKSIFDRNKMQKQGYVYWAL